MAGAGATSPPPTAHHWFQERTIAAWGAASVRPWEGALGRCLKDIYPGTLPLHLFTEVALPAGANVPFPNTTEARPGCSMTENTPSTPPQVVNLEGLAARLRGYVGGSFTQLLHRRGPLGSHVRAARAQQTGSTSSCPADFVRTVITHDHDEDVPEPDDTAPTNSAPTPTARTTSEQHTRCCPWEWDNVAPSPPALSTPPMLGRWAGTLRHALLLCGHPELVKVRESMFDSVTTICGSARDARHFGHPGPSPAGGRPGPRSPAHRRTTAGRNSRPLLGFPLSTTQRRPPWPARKP